MKSLPLVERFPDLETTSLAAAAKVVTIAAQAVRDRNLFAFALSGGHTPRRLYEILATEPYRRQIDWNHTRIFFSDERAVAPDRMESNYRMANEALLRHIPMRGGHIHRMEGEKKDKPTVATDYQAAIAATFGVSADGPPPAFDVILLGLGADGHTASLFPRSEALQEEQRWIVAHNVEELAAWRITMTVPLINAARNVFFLVSGPDKETALREVLDGPPDPERLPAQMIRPTDGQVLWFIDESKKARE